MACWPALRIQPCDVEAMDEITQSHILAFAAIGDQQMVQAMIGRLDIIQHHRSHFRRTMSKQGDKGSVPAAPV